MRASNPAWRSHRHLAEAASLLGLKECSAWVWQDEALLWIREGMGVLCVRKARDRGRKELEDELDRVDRVFGRCVWCELALHRKSPCPVAHASLHLPARSFASDPPMTTRGGG